MSTGADLVKVAERELGYVERPRNRTKYGEAYGLNGQPWCSVFVWWCCREVGRNVRSLAENWAYTPSAADGMRKAGMIVPETQAQPGDIVFMDFPDRVHRIQHVGICTGRTQGGLATIEGNTSQHNQANGGQVMRRGRPFSVIAAVGRLPWDAPNLDAGPKAVPPAPTPTAAVTLAEVAAALAFCRHAIVGDGRVVDGPAVKFVQTGINRANIGVFLTVDGKWGPATRDAVVWFQARRHLVTDGVVGPATWAALYP